MLSWTVDETSGFDLEMKSLPKGEQSLARMNLNHLIAPLLRQYGPNIEALSTGKSMVVKKESQFYKITYKGLEYMCKIHAHGFTFAYVSLTKGNKRKGDKK